MYFSKTTLTIIEHKKAGMAPWFDMLNHSPMNNAEFTFNADENTLYVQDRDRHHICKHE